MKIKKNILLMYATAFLQGMVFYAAVTTLYREAVGISVFQITLIESISLALALILELPCGIVADKIGYKNTIVCCNILYYLSKIVFWQANGFAMFLLERVLLSVVMAGLSGVDSSIIFCSCEENYVHKAFSIYGASGTLGMIVSACVYSMFMSGDYRCAALLTMITYGLAAILACFLQEVKVAESKKEHPVNEFVTILKDTVRQKNLLIFLIGVALFSECHQTITVFLNQLQYVRTGMNNSMIAVVYVVVTVTGLVEARSAAFSKRLGKRKSGALLFGTATVACLIMAVTKSPLFSILSIVVLRVSFSLMMPIVQTLENQMVTHKNRATALSIHATIMDGVAIATNLVYGKVSDVNLPLAFGIGAGFCLMGMMLFLIGTSERYRI